MRRLAISLAVAVLISTAMPERSQADTYNFSTITNPNDTAFDQLLGINDSGMIAGYYGDGMIVPNNGFTLTLNPIVFTTENYPNAAQTQVIGINGAGNTDGFYIDQNGVTHGFTDFGGVFATVDNPNPTSVLTQLLGLNAFGSAAGYWQNAAGTQFPFIELGGSFAGLDKKLPANTMAQATGIDDGGVVSGFYVDAAGNTHGFILAGSQVTTLDFGNDTNTTALGINNNGQVVGTFVDAAGMHGYVYNLVTGAFTQIDDPNGINSSGLDTTTVNGLNNLGQLVGFYMDANGNTDGFTATPTPEPSAWLLMITALGIAAYLKMGRRSPSGA